MPMISSIAECASAAARRSIPVIADGGIRTSGDVVKAILLFEGYRSERSCAHPAADTSLS